MKPAILIPAAAIVALALPVLAAKPAFDTPAPVAYLLDTSSDAELYSKDADRRMPPASMAKIMTVQVAFDLIKEGKLKRDQMFEVRPETWKKWHGPAAGSTMFLSPGEKVSVDNLLKGIVTLSGNDACVVLAEGIAGTEQAFVEQMNRTAQRLGRVAGADGLKTGHTEEAGYGFTGSAEQNGRRLIMVMAGLNSFNERISESVKFMDWGFRAWQTKPIVAAGKRVETAEVQLGDAGSVGLVAPRNLAVTLPGGGILAPDMKLKVVYDGPIKAPIAKGQHIADLVVETPDMGVQRLPLVAENDVGEAGFFRRAWAGFTGLFG